MRAQKRNDYKHNGEYGYGCKFDKASQEPQPPHKFDGKIQDNYDAYLKEGAKIGFTESYPMKEILDTISIITKCRNFNVQFSVYYAKFSFGKSYEFSVHGIYTDRVDIAHNLPLNGFGSYSCYDEAETMELGIIEMAKKHDLMICSKINSWPFAKAIIQPNHFKD